MNKIAEWPADRRRELFSETAAQKGMISAIVEKDFWVCWVLMRRDRVITDAYMQINAFLTL